MSCQPIPARSEVRWKEILNRYAAQPAIWSQQGKVLRTFEQVEEEASHLQSLFTRIPENSVAALDLENHPSWPALVIAAFRTKRILLPLDPSATEKTKNQIEALCGARVRIAARTDGQLGCKRLLHAAVPWSSPLPEFLKISSGTENGQLRAIRFTADQLLADCDQVCQTMQISAGDLHYGLIPFSHSYGFSSVVTPLIWRGVPFVVTQDRLPYAIAEGIRTTSATVLPAIPSLFQLLATLTHLPLRLCISAGAPLRSATAKAFHDRHGLKIHTFYGSSECGGICYDGSDDPLPPEGWVGTPLQGVSVTWDPSSCRIQISGKAVGLGYYPGENMDACFRPGDLLEKTPQGGFRLTGRVTDWINIGAKKVHPSEIESDLLRYPGIRDAIVFGVEAGGRGQQIHALIATEENIPIENLRRYCGDNLVSWKIPRHFHLVSNLPANERGKINRRQLAEQFANKSGTSFAIDLKPLGIKDDGMTIGST